MHGMYKDKPIEKAAKTNGLQVYRHPWDFGVAPDAVNEEGSEFYILYDLSNYLRRDRMTHEPIPAIRSAWVMRVRNPKTKDTTILIQNNGLVYDIGDPATYESLCMSVDMMKLALSKPDAD